MKKVQFAKYISRNTLIRSIAALSILGMACMTASAQLVIDDFSTGAFSKTLTQGSGYYPQTGTMAGGSRVIYLGVCGTPCSTDPFEQPNSFQVRKSTGGEPSALIFNTGYKSDAQLQVVYGEGKPMNLDLSKSYDRIRLYFDGADQFINFNLTVYTNGPYSSIGCNFNQPTGPGAAFTVDLPFTNFGGSADFSDITAMNFEFGVSQGNATGEDWALTAIEAVNGGTADVTCGTE